MPNPPNKHHYIPQFYLKNWAGRDDKVCQYSKPFGSGVVAKRVYPAATGFVKRLYSLRGFPEELAHQVEQRFFSPIDSQASEVMRVFTGEQGLALNEAHRSAWSRFLLSLMMRMPEDIDAFRVAAKNNFSDTSEEEEEKYRLIRKSGDPETFSEYMAQMPIAEFEASVFPTYMEMVDNRRIGEHINNMRWFTRDLNDAKHKLLTSDRPLVMTNGIATEDGHIVLPIGPKRIFAAVNSEK